MMFRSIMMRIPEHKLGDKVTCPVCGKTYVFSQENYAIAKGDYTCDWKCFAGHVKKVTSEKEDQKTKK